MNLFTDAERERISHAIARAEAKTSGEIVAVVAERSDDYIFIPLLWAALAALLVPLPFLIWGGWPGPQVYAVQLAVFAVGALLAVWEPVRFRLVPGPVKRARARRRAMEQFLAQNLHTTANRTGVLIFVSAVERYAEVIADTGIYGRVPPETWSRVVDGLTRKIREGEVAAGFIEAVDACGALLAEHFPPAPADTNELPDHLIVLD